MQDPAAFDKQRALARLALELSARLAELEDALLLALNEAGDLVDNDAVVLRLEQLKLDVKGAAEKARRQQAGQEAGQGADACAQATEAEGARAAFERDIQSWRPVADTCARMYVALQRLQAKHALCFSLAGLLQALESALRAPSDSRLDVGLAVSVHKSVAFGLPAEHRLLLAATLAQAVAPFAGVLERVKQAREDVPDKVLDVTRCGGGGGGGGPLGLTRASLPPDGRFAGTCACWCWAGRRWTRC
jgi:hypothetical protein